MTKGCRCFTPTCCSQFEDSLSFSHLQVTEAWWLYKLIARQARTESSRDRDLTATVMCSKLADKLYTVLDIAVAVSPGKIANATVAGH